jgi:hypothetical protein
MNKVEIFCKKGVVSFETFQRMKSLLKERPKPKKPAPTGKGKKRKKGGNT